MYNEINVKHNDIERFILVIRAIKLKIGLLHTAFAYNCINIYISIFVLV